jgi:NodT family efflux transporter outer membrane factor (OMF) lipoprotein
VAAALVLLGGCAVGPDFTRPAAPAVDRYSKEKLPAKTGSATVPGGGAQRFVAGRDIPGEWWTLFRSSALDRLIAGALKANPTLAAARANLRQAAEQLRAGETAFFPTAQLGFAASRNKSSTALAPVPSFTTQVYSLVTPQVAVSYAPDVFGGTRRQVESLAAAAEAQRFELEAAYLTLTANVVTAAIGEAALRGETAATRETIRIAAGSLAILKKQHALGQAAGADVAVQEAALAQAQTALPPLQKALAQQRDLISALAGRLPSAEPDETFELAALTLPVELPLSLPAKLVEQRPDVRAAAAELHSASADVGVAIAARLPQFTLTGNAGTTALAFAALGAPGNVFWTIGGNVAATLFDAGALLHKQRAAEAAFDAAKAQYRATVIAALQNVADTLRALHADADGLHAAAAAKDAAKKSLDIAERQWRAGAVGYLVLLTAEQAYWQALVNLVLAQASRFADTAALFQALGGGWWNRQDVAATAVDGDRPETDRHPDARSAARSERDGGPQTDDHGVRNGL